MPTTVLDEFLDAITTQVVEVGEHLAPDDDWSPMLIIQPRGDSPKPFTICALQVPLDNGPSKDLLTQVIVPKLVREADGERFALITTAWRLDVSAREELRRRHDSIAEHPDRVECVTIYAFDRDERKLALADITRRKDEHPLLGDWHRLETIEGRFADMWKALK